MTRSPLRVGDRIRIVRLPGAFAIPGYRVHPDTRWVFESLLKRGRSLRVFKIDESGLPWIHCKFRRKNGSWRYDSLLVDNHAWVKVKKRRK